MRFLSQLEAFHAQAADAVGLDDFGETDYREPMMRLLSDYDRHARFSEAGAAITAGEIVGKLAGRLLAQQGFKSVLAATDANISKPLIIIGMPRTGTTALHRLISQDPATQALEMWLGAMPMPRPPRQTWTNHPLFQQVSAQIDALHALSPSFKSMHPVYADQADECRFALDQAFWSPGAAAMAPMPDYAAWCLDVDARYAYRYYRKVLQLISAGDGRRWVLKNPDHIFALDALLNVFPDACIVQTHRDPLISLASVASMSYDVLRGRVPGRTRAEHGLDMNIWIRALEKSEAVRSRHDPRRFFDLHIDEIKQDQIACVHRIYEYFHFPIDEAAIAAWRARASGNPKSDHGEHHYSAAAFGLSSAVIKDQAPHYWQRYTTLYAAQH